MKQTDYMCIVVIGLDECPGVYRSTSKTIAYVKDGRTHYVLACDHEWWKI